MHALGRSTASSRAAAIIRMRGLAVPLTLALYMGMVCAQLISARYPIGIIALSAAGLVWMASCDNRDAAQTGWLSALFGWLGERAYSIYLCHVPILLVSYEILWRAGGQAPLPAPWLAAAGLGSFGLIVFIGTLSHRYLEQPGIQWGRRLTRPATRSI
ncbi:acyltransferase family protein [Cupriavidus basilensis]|uniref:acyltransferase family protein n=1 Tax=Cupriavidus basilensis TaxID=68895 RepID=UPI001300C88A|nr:acyltransferase family protein [Cupriavidus basilensis]